VLFDSLFRAHQIFCTSNLISSSDVPAGKAGRHEELTLRVEFEGRPRFRISIDEAVFAPLMAGSFVATLTTKDSLDDLDNIYYRLMVQWD
jgi:hypothetical protein